MLGIEINELVEELGKGTYALDNSISLYGGVSGLILTYSILYLDTNDQRYKEIIDEKIKDVILLIEEEDSYLSPTFADGLAGFGWLMCYLQENGIIDYLTDDFLEEVDSYLDKALDLLLLDNNFDLLHGALGIGLYFIKRKNHKSLSKIILHLLKIAEIDDVEIKFKTYSKAQQSYVYDFGLAHGHASIMYFLNKCLLCKCEIVNCEILINGISEFYANNISKKSNHSYFPSTISIEEYKIEHRYPYKSKLAWCYGDLGILYTLFNCDNLKKINKNDIEALLQKTAQRKNYDSTFVNDAFLCHGCSGLAIIFLSLFEKTKNDLFLTTAQYWISMVPSYRSEDSNTYKFDMGNGKYKSNKDFLTGISGLLTVLLTLRNHKLNIWTEAIFLT